MFTAGADYIIGLSTTVVVYWLSIKKSGDGEALQSDKEALMNDGEVLKSNRAKYNLYNLKCVVFANNLTCVKN